MEDGKSLPRRIPRDPGVNSLPARPLESMSPVPDQVRGQR